jgi:hypothetical protein
VEVEGRSLAGVSSRDAAHALAGPSGSYVLVSVRRQDTHKGTVVVTTHLVRDVSEDNAIEATFAAMGQAKDVERFWKQLGITCNDKMEHQLQEARIREMHSQRAHMVNVRLAHRTQEKDLQIPTLNTSDILLRHDVYTTSRLVLGTYELFQVVLVELSMQLEPQLLASQ